MTSTVLEADVCNKVYMFKVIAEISSPETLQMDSGLSFQEKAEQTIKTNYFGVLHVTNTFAPLLQPNSR